MQKYTSPFLDDLCCQVSGCYRCWRCFMPPSFAPFTFHQRLPLKPPGTHSSIQTEIQPHQTSVLVSEGHTGIYFYFSLEPLPPEHLIRFHTSSLLQSPTETQSSCLSSIFPNNLMSDYLQPFICVQFPSGNRRSSLYLRQRCSGRDGSGIIMMEPAVGLWVPDRQTQQGWCNWTDSVSLLCWCFANRKTAIKFAVGLGSTTY